MPSRLATEKAAQAWCTPTTEKIDMIPELAEAFANILDEVWGRSDEVPECAYCGEPITDIEKAVYLDESGVDGIFCGSVCAGAFIMDAVDTVAHEDE